MNINEIIKYPILTEKTYSQMENNIFTFAVDRRTNKTEVKKTIEIIFKVKVAKVNIANIPKKPKKLGKFHGFTNAYKKAVITLSEGTINLFPDEVKTEAKFNKAKEKTPDVPSEAELKAAKKIADKLKANDKDLKPVQAEIKETLKTEIKKVVAKPKTNTKDKIKVADKNKTSSKPKTNKTKNID